MPSQSLGPELAQLLFNDVLLAKAGHRASLSKEGPPMGRNTARAGSLGATKVTLYHSDDVAVLPVKMKSFFKCKLLLCPVC